MPHSPRIARLAGALAAVAAAVPVLAACANGVTLEPAAGANDPACAEVTVRLPDTVAELPQRETDAQATGAWGAPAVVLLHCGVTPPGPTTDTCVSLDGIDWVVDDTEAPVYRFTTYGREPAVEVVVDSEPEGGEFVSGTTSLMDLKSAVETLPVTGECVGAEDVLS